MIFFDTETCGFHGPIVLLQWAKDDGPVNLHEVWKRPIRETMELIEQIVSTDVCAFNIAFDWFHICQLYTTLRLCDNIDSPPNKYNYALREAEGRDGPCLKPKSALDLMLFARKGPYQKTMARKDIRIRRIPTQLAWKVADELEKRITFDDILFAKHNKEGRRWKVMDIMVDGRVDKDFKDILLSFSPSSSLKAIVADLTGNKTIQFNDIKLPKQARPFEKGWAPFATAFGRMNKWNGTWPVKIYAHIEHWAHNVRAREYATDDVKYLQLLYDKFGRPESGDDDSELAVAVGASRWRGFAINVEGITQLRDEAKQRIKDVPTDPAKAKIYIKQAMAPEEADLFTSTKRNILEKLAQLKADCPKCEGEGCTECDKGEIPHPAGIRANEVLKARQDKYNAAIFDKLLIARRFHASFEVIGALSSRMAGNNGLNAHGINHSKYIRKMFTLAFPGYWLNGGDFNSFELSIVHGVYGDPKFDEDLSSGIKVHAILGMEFFPGTTYEEVIASDGTDNDMYDKGKRGVFGYVYGGDYNTWEKRLNVPLEIGTVAYQRLEERYKVMAEKRNKIFDMFTALKQPGGIGKKVYYTKPAEYIESILGFRRYFPIENEVVRVLFDLGENPPESWLKLKIKVVRREGREQWIGNAVRSAMFAAAFGLQGANKRAAGNHVIQSPGATITKRLQRRLWNLQPCGIHEWVVQTMNIHDEVHCPSKPEVAPLVENIVNEFVAEYKKIVPRLGISWRTNMKSWAEK